MALVLDRQGQGWRIQEADGVHERRLGTKAFLIQRGAIGDDGLRATPVQAWELLHAVVRKDETRMTIAEETRVAQ